MSDVYFDVWYDKTYKSNIIIFATDYEVNVGDVSGDALMERYDDIEFLREVLGVYEILHEDYIIETDLSIEEAVGKVESYGFVRDKRIRKCGWV